MLTSKRLLVLWACLATVGLAAAQAAPLSETARAETNPTALDRYVYAPDPNYSYRLVDTIDGDDWRGCVLEMTSQAWLSADEVQPHVWKHWLSIVYPKKVKSTTALLLIGGGSISMDAPRGGESMLRRMARESKTVTAQIYGVPNEPLVFTEEGKRRTEDALIAYTWDQYLRTGDERWPARLPMTKAAVRALDTIQAFSATKEGGGIEVESFVVAGGSKRGWTTWTTAAVDKRVIACMPVVIDMLNLVPSFAHHWSTYGFWAPAIGDYTALGIMNWLGSKEFDALMGIVEPYHYRDRLTMPKLLVNACGDQFFVPTSSQFYIDDLEGPTYFCYVPNVGHGACGNDGMGSLRAFYQAIVNGTKRPEYTWSFPDANTIRVETKTRPKEVLLWQAHNAEARDFRIDVIGRTWTSTVLEDQGGGVYTGSVETPEAGWRAYVIQLAFKGAAEDDLKLSTPVRVVPDKTPHEFVYPDSPKGFLSAEN